MGEFRIGRKHASHSYPESRRNTTLPFARNFAQGPALSEIDPVPIASSPGTLVPWDTIEGGGGPSVSVPITPQVTGVVRLIGALTVEVVGEGPATFFVFATIDGVPGVLTSPTTTTLLLTTGDRATVPFVLDIGPGSTSHPAPLNPGTTYNIGILLVAAEDDVLALTLRCSTLDIQELPAATG